MTSSAMASAASAASAVPFGWEGRSCDAGVAGTGYPFPFSTGFLAARRLYPSSRSSTATLEGAPATSRTRRGTR